MKKLDNRGFTLTELIVVIAIMGILAGATSASINQIFSNQTRKFINDCDAMLTRCRVETLSGAPDGTCVELRCDSNGKCYVAYYEGGSSDPIEEEQLKRSSASCTYVKEDGSTGTLGRGNSLQISYDRTSGAMNETYTEIAVGNSKIALVPATGYHKVGG